MNTKFFAARMFFLLLPLGLMQKEMKVLTGTPSEGGY
jgi:hypothetical protein